MGFKKKESVNAIFKSGNELLHFRVPDIADPKHVPERRIKPVETGRRLGTGTLREQEVLNGERPFRGLRKKVEPSFFGECGNNGRRQPGVADHHPCDPEPRFFNSLKDSDLVY
jgi:hypothetical protein